MIVKIKCKCGAEHFVKKDTLIEAKKVKRINRNYICDKCQFRIMARNTVREIVLEVMRA